MTTQQISSVLGISQDTIRRWRKAGVIPQGHQVHEFAPIEWSESDLIAIREFMVASGREHYLTADLH